MIVLAIGDLGFTGPLNIGLTLLAGERGWIVSGFGAGAATASLLLAVRGRLPTLGWCRLRESRRTVIMVGHSYSNLASKTAFRRLVAVTLDGVSRSPQW